MKNFSISYIIIFSAIMVSIVATILSFISLQLKPVQERNIKTEQMQSILAAVNIESTTKDAEEKFSKYIIDSYVINSKGKKLENKVAFDVDMKKEYSKIQNIKTLKDGMTTTNVSPFKNFLSSFIDFKKVEKNKINSEVNKIANSRELPVYICEKNNTSYYVFPLRGKGLWGPIWGYVSLEEDFNTIHGANFDHKSETPGLGAEINQTWFEKQFKNKTIFDNDKFISVKVVKGGTDDSNPYGVDAISGGTITSKGLEAMVFDCLGSYTEFFKIKKQSDE